ncbi:hypothetical protein GCM10011390_28920 [Aureimonas endophytica]|uniref:Uncharacterized protein n=1 Tax=Aureimonas endophytica TaxID=2027858 RepID=A0A916ZPP8_9HYPH|nr:hypothetical protein [Aureimonas endophytica]GGE08088.1 hypothetical protein GCM10011390_28920 [Aureimonas endophytica]
MIIRSLSFLPSATAMPAGPMPAVHPGGAAPLRDKSGAAPAAAAEPAPSVATPEAEARLQDYYFEAMVNSAADLLLRSHIAPKPSVEG